MKRRKFLQQSAAATAGVFIMKDLLARDKGPVFGHNGMRYRLDTKWGVLNPIRYPVKDCHEMVQDRKGKILLLTNETKNNVLVYSTGGRLLDSWGHQFPGGHGLTLHNENGEDFLYITDTEKHQVYKTTIKGKILLTIDAPLEAGIYKESKEFCPTETAIDDNGDIYIADGYGLQYILHYASNGKLKNYFGGKGEGDAHFECAHGITIDRRYEKPTLLITDRPRCCFKRFSMEGRLQEIICLPGAWVCRPVIKGDHIFAGILRCPDMGISRTGFTTILDKSNKVVSNIGGCAPEYKDGQLQPLKQAERIFAYCHDVCVDKDDNLYVAQWGCAGKVYPYKLYRV